MNEAQFLAALRSLPLHPGARNLEDDCAIISLGAETLVLTLDMMAEDTHFRPDADMANVAWKLVASNLSDLASKGAQPVGLLLGYSLGSDDGRFLVGLREALGYFGVPLLGGDTIAATGASTLAITAIGRATCVPVPARSGAQAGDGLYITGPVGRAMLGFEGRPEHMGAFDRPTPRIAEGIALAPYVSAMMDVSDGLLLDAWRMAQASGVTIELDAGAIPVADPGRRDECLRWGDDYELLFTAPDGNALPHDAHLIGNVVPKGLAPLVLEGVPLPDPDLLGYRHG